MCEDKKSIYQNNLAIFAWYFPPVGGPGVQRTLKLIKYLPQSNWCMTVFGGIDTGEHQDPGLVNEIPKGVVVHRLGRPDSAWRRLRKWLFAHRLGPIGLGRLGHWGGFVKDFPDTMREWADAVVEQAETEHRHSPFNVIYTTSYPYSAHLAGMRLKHKLSIPWVADLRDPWEDNELMLGQLPGWMRARHALAERRMIRGCDAVVCAHPGHADRLRVRYGLSADQCVAITNGYDPEDYQDFPPLPAIGEDGVVRLVHTGSFYGDYSPAPLVRALEQAWRALPAGIKTLELRLIGGDGGASFPDRPGLRVVVHQRVSHAEALQEQAAAHLLLCVFDRRTGATNVSGKLFEYLATGRPILGILPTEGTMADIIRTTRTGYVADCDSPDDIMGVLHALFADRVLSNSVFAPDLDAIARYSRPELALRLSAVLNRVIGQAAKGGDPRTRCWDPTR